MIQIFLDGVEVVPLDTASFKFTAQNPFFTKSGSYTYDVELPLAVDANRRLFGWIQRMDCAKEKREFRAELVVDNVRLLTGTAHVTSVDEDSVKVQLLGEAASYNYGNKMDDLYLDTLDMGDWYSATWPDRSYWEGRPVSGTPGWKHYPANKKFTGPASIVFTRAGYDADGNWSNEIQNARLFSGELPWVAFPVQNITADFHCNGYCYQFTDANRTAVNFYLRAYVGEYAGHRRTQNDTVLSGVIQPYVWFMAERIAAATGFVLDREDNALYTDEFFRRIFIVNANNYIECNKCMPHWTVNEWWTQVENTFGVVLAVDYGRKKMKLLQRSKFYGSSAARVTINNVVDEYSAEVDDEEQADISVNNVSFADAENAPEDRLSDFITGNAEVNTDFASLEELRAWATGKDMTGYKGTIFDCADGRRYIYSEADGLVEVDMFRPRITDNDRDADEVELKFVPARYIDGSCELYAENNRRPGGIVPEDAKVIGNVPVRILAVPNIPAMDWYKTHEYSTLDIEKALAGDEEVETAEKDSGVPDVIYLAIANLALEHHFETVDLEGGGTFYHDFRYPRALLRARKSSAIDGETVYADSPLSLSLIPIADEENLATHTIGEGVRINTKVRYCIRFVADRIPDTGAIFLIRNRRFVCEKIEADIAPDGLRKLLTGYFYELALEE